MTGRERKKEGTDRKMLSAVAREAVLQWLREMHRKRKPKQEDAEYCVQVRVCHGKIGGEGAMQRGIMIDWGRNKKAKGRKMISALCK